MATSFLPHVPATTDENVFPDTGIGFREQMRVLQRCRKSAPLVVTCMWTAPYCDLSRTNILWHIHARSGCRPPHQKEKSIPFKVPRGATRTLRDDVHRRHQAGLTIVSKLASLVVRAVEINQR